jgi:preprotein translocase subunit YajC
LGTPSQGAPGGFNPMFMILPVLAVFALTTLMAGRKDKKKREQLMSSLKKQDRVQMVGGEIGIVTDLSDDEVVLRVEEGRIRYARSAVQTILSSRAKGETIAEVKGEAKTTAV